MLTEGQTYRLQVHFKVSTWCQHELNGIYLLFQVSKSLELPIHLIRVSGRDDRTLSAPVKYGSVIYTPHVPLCCLRPSK